MLVLGLLIGAALGGIATGADGLLWGAVLGGVLGHLLAARKQPNALEARIAALEAKVAALEAGPARASTALAATAEIAEAGPVAAPLPPAPTLPPAAEPPAITDWPDSEPADPPAAPPPKPSRPAVEMPAWAQRLWGANTIVKLGLGILFLGLAFLARYAAERVTLPIELRLAGIAAVGLLLLGIGWRLRVRRPAYGLALQGGGVAVLYLVLFAGAKVFGLLGLLPAFALMVLIAGFAALLAVLQNAQALAVLGSLGGYVTPLLLSSGGGQFTLLAAYYLVLGLGVAAIAWAKLWPRLNLMAFGFSALLALAWADRITLPADYLPAQVFLIAFWLLFLLILLLPGRRASEPDRWLNASLLFGVPVLGSALQYGLLRPRQMAIALAALLIGAVYIGLAAWLRKRAAQRTVFEAFVALGAVFATLVIPFALSAEATAGAWALEGAGAIWLGLRQQSRRVVGAGLLLMLLGGMGLAGAMQGAWGSGSWSSQLLNAALLALAGFAAARWLQLAGFALQLLLPQGLIGWATLWLAVALGLLVERWLVPPLLAAGVLCAVALVVLLLVGLQRRWQWPAASWPVALLAPIWIAWGLLQAQAHGAPLLELGWLALGAALLAQALVLQHSAPHWPGPLRDATHVAALLGLALLGALQGSHASARLGDAASAWAWLGWLLAPALLLALLIDQQARGSRRWPLHLAPAAYQVWGAGLLALALAAWVLLANWGSNGSARPLPHLPLLNPLDIGLGASLLVLTRWLRGADRWRAAAPRALPALLAGLAFLWLNGMLIRAFHHWGGVPYRVEDWLQSWGVQTGLALLWSLLALLLMWHSTKRQQRSPWLVGAGLLGAVVLKLLVFDLQGSGTVTRIVSFIGVGGLMLVIGYVAPLPGSRPEKAADA